MPETATGTVICALLVASALGWVIERRNPPAAVAVYAAAAVAGVVAIGVSLVILTTSAG